MPRIPLIRSCAAALVAFCLTGFAPLSLATDVVMRTPLGDFEVELFDEEAPQTVANFLSYVRDGSYDDNMVHRSLPGYVIQTGSFKLNDGVFSPIGTRDPVQNEPGIPNTRGTLAMAKIPDEPDSATTSWFINLVDNPSLDTQNEGFTVFGRVKGNGMEVVDAIADLQTWRFNRTLTDVPLIDFDGDRDLELEDFVTVDVDEVVDFAINPGLNDAWFESATDGQGLFFTVYPDIGKVFLAWFTFDVERPADEAGASVGEAGHRWVTALGSIEGNRAELNATLTTGGLFDSANPGQENVTDYGTIVVEFSGCDGALVNYAFPDVDDGGLHGTVALERVSKDNVSLCEALDAQVTSD